MQINLHVNYSLIIFVALNVKKKTTVELLNESEKASLYSISFEMDGTTEFEKFVAEFEMNATFNRDYQRIIAALQAILRIGALERFFRPEGNMSVLNLQRFEKILEENIEKGYVSIEEKELTGIEDISFEI